MLYLGLEVGCMGASFCLLRRLGSSIPRGVWSPVDSEGKPTVCAGGNGAGDVYSRARLGLWIGHGTVQRGCRFPRSWWWSWWWGEEDDFFFLLLSRRFCCRGQNATR